MSTPDLLANKHQPRVGRKRCRGHTVGEAKGNVQLSRAERLAQRLPSNIDLAGIGLCKRRQELGRPRMIATHRGRPRLHIRARRFGDGEARIGRRRRKRQSRDGCAAEPLTCSGNWGLRHLPE